MLNATRRFADRLGGAFALTTLLVALVGLGALAAVHAVRPPATPPAPYAVEAELLRSEGLRSVVAARNFALTKDSAWQSSRDAAEATIAQSVQRLRGQMTTPASLQALEVVERRAQDLDLSLDREAIGVTTGLGTFSQLLADASSRQQGFDEAVSRLVNQASRESVASWRKSNEEVLRARRSVAAAGAAAILFAAGFGLLLMRRYSREFDQAQQAVRAREEFLSMASEELSRPLSALAHHVEPVREALHKPSATEHQDSLARHLDVANHELSRLEELVHELHEAAQLKSGHDKLRRETLDLAEVARTVAHRFDDRLRATGTSIVVQAHSIVRGAWDRARLEEALTQLMASAIRHGAGKVVKVGIEGGDPARLTIRDHGNGLAREQQAHLFEAYDVSSEADHTDTLGLGLYIARQIVEEHGGRIRVLSNPGVGTLVTVELPRSVPVARTPWPRRSTSSVGQSAPL